MQSLTILEESGDVTRLLRDMLPARHYALRRSFSAEHARCALLVVAADWCGAVPESVCRILLTPPGKASQLRAVRAEWVVSFGAAARESISFSSLDANGLTLCIRRTLPTLSGRVLEPQELPLHCPAAAPETMLAACAAALLARGE